MSSSPVKCALVTIALALIGSASAKADQPVVCTSQSEGPAVCNFVVLRVSFSDLPKDSSGVALTRFADSETETYFNNVAQLWGAYTSYGNISLKFQIISPYEMPQMSKAYLGDDRQSGTFIKDKDGNIIKDKDGNPTFNQGSLLMPTLLDAVANIPTTTNIDWSNVYGVIVLFADPRPRPDRDYLGAGPSEDSRRLPRRRDRNRNKFSRRSSENKAAGPTFPRMSSPPGVGGRQIGHQLQGSANPTPPHPSNYNSNFEQMDNEYPAQSGVFEKQSSKAFPRLPEGKYLVVDAPPKGAGASAGLAPEERPPEYLMFIRRSRRSCLVRARRRITL